MRFEVAVPKGGTEGVLADAFKIKDGVLTFTEWRGIGKPHHLVIAYAPHAWTAFWERED